MLNLILPFPPSVNSYWGFKGSHRYLTPKAKDFKQSVFWLFRQSQHKGFGGHRLSVSIIFQAPDRRKRDLDNYLKSLLDSLTQAGVYNDDSQIDFLSVSRGDIAQGGLTRLSIEIL